MLPWLRVSFAAHSQTYALRYRNCALRGTKVDLSLLPSVPPSSLGTRHASSKAHKNKEKDLRSRDKGNKEPSSKDKVISTASLKPGSEQPIVNEAALEEYAKAEAAMRTAVDWFKKECSAAETRASGRVTPALLAPVRVKVAGTDNVVSLDQIATVGVRDGTTLIVTVFDETSVKHVEQAIYEAKIPHVVPQKHDSRTIKIPIPKPTVEARIAEYTTQQRKAEDIRIRIRKANQTSVKRGKYSKHSIELAEFQKLSERYISEVDQILATLKKATGAK